uniref:inositol-phosphate phosphatase n=1 Tax=Lygus hesperus TaxID=30085 RepID=A0A0A9WGF4_LYGHE
MNFGGTIRVNRFGLLLICCLLILFIYYLSPSSPPEDEPKVNLRRVLMAALAAAERGGKEVLKGTTQSLGTQSKGETKEGVNIPVTDADYNSHCVMYYGIAKMFPFVKVISEEKEGEKKCTNLQTFELDDKALGDLLDEDVLAADVAVWIDPLDATKEYTEKKYEYVTTMVCVSHRGKPIIGVIHKPFGEEPKTSWAWLNNGMSPNLKVVDDKTGDNSHDVLVSISHAGKVEKLIEPIFGSSAKLVAAAGSGYKTLEVAVGNATAYIHSTDISKWDICAGDAILTATGGHFSSLKGDPIDYSSNSPSLHSMGVLAARNKYPDYLANAKKNPLTRGT